MTFTFSDGTEYTPKALSLSVSVTNSELTKKDISWKTSGKLDAIDRANSGVTATPKISKLNAVISDVQFSDADLAAALDQKLDMAVVDGKIKITLKPSVDVSTKDKFVVHPITTLANEDGIEFTSLEAPSITVKPTQSTVKMSLSPSQTTMYRAASYTHEVEYTYTLKGAAGAEVEDVVLTNMTDYFEVTHDAEHKQIRVELKNDSVLAKTHTLKFQVSFADHTTNAKPLSVSTKVVIKK